MQSEARGFPLLSGEKGPTRESFAGRTWGGQQLRAT
jgi:hypothetical protein